MIFIYDTERSPIRYSARLTFDIEARLNGGNIDVTVNSISVDVYWVDRSDNTHRTDFFGLLIPGIYVAGHVEPNQNFNISPPYLPGGLDTNYIMAQLAGQNKGSTTAPYTVEVFTRPTPFTYSVPYNGSGTTVGNLFRAGYLAGSTRTWWDAGSFIHFSDFHYYPGQGRENGVFKTHNIPQGAMGRKWGVYKDMTNVINQPNDSQGFGREAGAYKVMERES